MFGRNCQRPSLFSLTRLLDGQACNCNEHQAKCKLRPHARHETKAEYEEAIEARPSRPCPGAGRENSGAASCVQHALSAQARQPGFL